MIFIFQHFFIKNNIINHGECDCFNYFLWLSNIPLCVCVYIYIVYSIVYIHIFFIYSSAGGQLDFFYILAIVNNAATKIGVHIYFQINVLFFFRYIPRSGIVGSYDSFTFNFWRNSHNFFHSGCTILHSHQQYAMLPCFPHPHQNLLFVFLIVAILTVMRCYLIVGLICISLMISNVEHLFMYLLAFCISLLEKWLLWSSVHFLKKFYWSILDLQFCVHFSCTVKWISYTYTYIHSF